MIVLKLIIPLTILALSMATTTVCSFTTTTTYFGATIRSRKTQYHHHRHHHQNAASALTSSLHMGMKVNIRIVGRKSSEPWLEEGVDMYEKRLRPSNVEVDTTWHKDNAALMKGIDMDRSKSHKVICLDPTGTQPTSEKFSDQVYQWLEEGGSRLSFVIGGAEGLPTELKYPSYTSSTKKSNNNNNNNKDNNNKPPIMISLSVLTFTHQFARLLLIEQIYRATEIQKGSGYHK